MPEKRTLKVNQLDLDITNPRGMPQSDPINALSTLLAVERAGEKVYELARDICDAGMLDPGDRLYVTPSSVAGRFVVLDGNRRLAALKLLTDGKLIDRPELAASESIRSRFKRLQTEYSGGWPTEVDVVVFDSREEAKRFIRLRHTGENSGAGRSAWSALQVARFDGTGLWQCLEILRNSRKLGWAVTNQLDQSTFNISTFERVIATEEFQRRFGCSIGKNAFSAGGRPARAMHALSKVAGDVATGRVTSRGDFAETKYMIPYIDEIEQAVDKELSSAATSQSSASEADNPTKNNERSEGPSSTQSPEASDSDATNTNTASTANMGSTTEAPTRKKRVSKYLIPKDALVTVGNPKCREIVAELKQKIAVDSAPYACALLLRCLQELTAEIYVTIVMKQKTTDRSANIETTARHLIGTQHHTDPGDKADIAKNFLNFRQTYEELSSAAHSKLTVLSANHLRSTWANLGGGMDLLWKRIRATEVAESSANAPAK